MFFNSFFRYFLYLTGTKFILAPDTPTGDMELEMKKIESIVKDENELNNIYSLNLMKLLNGGNSL